MTAVEHRRFAAFWDWMTRHEGDREREFRQLVVGKCRGNTLEIGFGVGSNWPFLPDGITYTGIEPDPYMRERAERRLPAESKLVLLDGDAQTLPFDAASFDTVLGTLVFCTIPDPQRALTEVHRVLKPGGQFCFWEHVRAHGRVGSILQDGVAPVWSRLGGGCHPNRDTEAAILRAGFEFDDLQHAKIAMLPAIHGVATVPRRDHPEDRR